MKEYNLTINGNSIFVMESQFIGKSAIVFIHGNSLSSECFRGLFDSSLSKMYRLIAFDFPGHGKSSRSVNPEQDYTFLGMVKTLKEVIAELNLEDYILVGHSLGGHIAIQASTQLFSKGLVTYGTPPLAIPPAIQEAFIMRQELMQMFTPEITPEQIHSVGVAFSDNRESQNLIAAEIAKADPLVRAFIGKSIMENAFIADEIVTINEAPFPVLVMLGEKDGMISRKYFESATLHNLWENKIHLLKDAGHCGMMESEGEFGRALDEYVENV